MRAPGASGRAAARRGLLVAAALAWGCDALVDPDYLGEPLAAFAGRVVGASDPRPLEAAMLWQRGPPPSYSDVELATRAPVDAGFPASFTLRLYQPPPAAAWKRLAPGEIRFARANAAAIPYGVAADAVPGVIAAPASEGWAIDTAHWVVYLEAAVPPGSLTEWWLGGALPRGYRLLAVTAGCPTPEALAACIAELQRRGVPEDGSGAPGTADAFCRAPYRLAPAPPGEEIVLALGQEPPPAEACP